MNKSQLFIKICGIKRPEDAEYAASSGASAIGMVFYPESPRFVDFDSALRIVEKVKNKNVLKTGVFVNEDPEKIKDLEIKLKLDFIQLHGNEEPGKYAPFKGKIIKAVKVNNDVIPERELSEWENLVYAFLLEGYTPRYGGDSAVFKWEIAKKISNKYRVLIAGGLTPDNIKKAVEKANPFGVDVSSGVETSPGFKSKKLIREFIENARGEKIE